jgi:hypothetical protein
MTTETLLLHPAFLCLGTFASIMIALEIGHQLALRHKTSAKEISGGAVDAAIFALLGLLIAFTFSGAAQRLDHRRDLIVQEANAIGTAWLRIDTLPAAAQTTLRADFRTYIDSRKAAYAVINDRAAFQAALARSAQIQRGLWQDAVQASQRPDALPAAEKLLLPALNEMIDITTTRAMATRMHPPGIIYAMLFAVTLVSAVLAGYGLGASQTRSWIHRLAFAATLAITLTVIIDMEHPRRGLITLTGFEAEAFGLGLPR